MKQLIQTVLIAATFAAVPTFAQQVQEPEDEVVASGTIRTDRAMAAFLAGDFEKAEIEFQKNARCALRATRSLEAGVESARESTLRPDTSIGTNTAPQPSGGPGGGAVALPTSPTATPSVNVQGTNFQKDESIAARTCDDRGFQLYMKGLSQIKLGKLDEAKKSLKSAIVLRKTIHDAHFRLALLEYQDGNMSKAKKQFQKLRKLEKKCKDCEFKDDMVAQVAYLQKLLG